MSSSVLEKLVEIRGIETNYVDAWGKPAIVSDASKAKLLETMGYSVSDEQALQSELKDFVANNWMQPLNPVQVNRIGEPLVIALRLPIELVNDDYTLKFTLEDGSELEQAIIPADGELINVVHIDDVEFQEYIIDVKHQLPLGYHDVQLLGDDGDKIADMRQIIAPKACFKPQNIANNEKVWGLSVQLYCVRSETNWGVGDFSDLTYLIKQSGRQGAQFVGLNPIHALYPADPEACSPYGPSSRRWLNFIYIDVSKLDGYQDPSVQEIVNAPEFQSALQHVRNIDYVDYEAVVQLKLKVLKAIFEVQWQKSLSKNTKLNKVFKAFIEEGGESLAMLATYDAIQEKLANEGKASWGWPVFPSELSEFHKPGVEKFKKANNKNVKFYMFLQWQAALQLDAAQSTAVQAGMSIGIYRDLAVGVSEGSAEIWGNRDLYVTDASVGAPPDVLGPLGQNWGLPPMDPETLYQQKYQPIIDLFSSNMKSAGALRIDHVMALLRLWWVPKGENAKAGGYVYYPVDDLLGILALESCRNENLVIGEDLGTVPDEIRIKLAENGVHSYRVFFFEQAKDGGFYSPHHYPVQSMSTLTTHDMPTLTGFWHCLDLEKGKELGLYPSDEVLQELYSSRHENKQQILNTLHGHFSIPDWMGRHVEQVAMVKELNHGMQYHMAKGSSALLSLQLEDWLEMDKPVNIPGTFKEYPNWKRKLTRNLEQIFSDPVLNSLALGLTETRKKASNND
ncbi:4-alpha-glucanotransferase [Planctobacterium marinum]|uniref:4-alpha-glucanotransferase n=1 Tax=Planctobacterium marinum TaxID=1631968 RepID=A0AA48HJN6_9ALTE|nr:4-alpha-glucanotransferase [Planctobacterium marinum]